LINHIIDIIYRKVFFCLGLSKKIIFAINIKRFLLLLFFFCCFKGTTAFVSHQLFFVMTENDNAATPAAKDA
jgi:hypothetical protein